MTFFMIISSLRIPFSGLSKTYTTNSMVPDSAATAFSMFSGVKTNYYTMGYDSGIQASLEGFLEDFCETESPSLHSPSLIMWSGGMWEICCAPITNN